MAADLTPELLAQLEREATSRVTVWSAGQPLTVWASATHDVMSALVAAAKERDQLRLELQTRADIDAIANALHDADHLQAHIAKQAVEIERMSELLGQSQFDRVNLAEQADQLRAEVERLEERQQSHLATIARLSQTAPFAEEVQGWEGQRAKMIAEVGTLRAEIERLRRLGLEAVALLEDDGVHDGDIERLRVEIERKP